MEQIPFVKYHGAGNDFILVDDRSLAVEQQLTTRSIAHACHRHFGVGADGLMLLQPGSDGADFFMRYYNSDGRVSTFCGNGGRCMVAFGASLGLFNDRCRFLGTDGWHAGEIITDGFVRLSMQDIDGVETLDLRSFRLDTGSPHYVRFVDDIESVDVFREGRMIRHDERFAPGGLNVNFVQLLDRGNLAIRTYERGVENETLACGTGVVAAAAAAAVYTQEMRDRFAVEARGGNLAVDFQPVGQGQFRDVWLTGPVARVFEGFLPV